MLYIFKWIFQNPYWKSSTENDVKTFWIGIDFDSNARITCTSVYSHRIPKNNTNVFRLVSVTSIRAWIGAVNRKYGGYGFWKIFPVLLVRKMSLNRKEKINNIEIQPVVWNTKHIISNFVQIKTIDFLNVNVSSINDSSSFISLISFFFICDFVVSPVINMSRVYVRFTLYLFVRGTRSGTFFVQYIFN